MIGSDNMEVPGQSQSLGEANGAKTVSDLIDDDVSVKWYDTKGDVTGTIKYVSDYSSAYGKTEKIGHFFPLKIAEEYYDQELTVTGSKNGDKNFTPTADDPYLIMRLENFTENPIVKVKSSGEQIFTLDFSKATWAGAGADALIIADQGEDMDAVSPASTLIKDDVKITWNGNKGKVSGTVHYYKFTNGHFKDDPEGHYVPVVVKNYDGKTIKATGSSGKTASLQDPKWIIMVDKFINLSKQAILSCDGYDFAILDFTDLVLEPPTGEYAVILPDQARDFGTFGKVTDYLDTDVALSWKGTEGTVTGKIKYAQNVNHFGDDEKNGNYYPLVLNSYFTGKNVQVNSKTEAETEWIVYLNKLLTRDKKITVKYNDALIATLDFSTATIEPAPVI